MTRTIAPIRTPCSIPPDEGVILAGIAGTHWRLRWRGRLYRRLYRRLWLRGRADGERIAVCREIQRSTLGKAVEQRDELVEALGTGLARQLLIGLAKRCATSRRDGAPIEAKLFVQIEQEEGRAAVAVLVAVVGGVRVDVIGMPSLPPRLGRLREERPRFALRSPARTRERPSPLVLPHCQPLLIAASKISTSSATMKPLASSGVGSI